MQTQTAKFSNGQAIVIQPTPQSSKLYGHVKTSYWQDSFQEFAYLVDLNSGDKSMAWEKEIHAESSTCPYRTPGCESHGIRMCMKCKQAFGVNQAEWSADEREEE